LIWVVSHPVVFPVRWTPSPITRPAESAASSVGEPAQGKRNLVPASHLVIFVLMPWSYFFQSEAHSRNMAINLGSTVLSISGLVGATYRQGVGSSSSRWPMMFSIVTDLPICVPMTKVTREKQGWANAQATGRM